LQFLLTQLFAFDCSTLIFWEIQIKVLYSCGIKISGTIFLSLQQNLCKASSTVIMTEIQKLNFSVSVTQTILNFEMSVSCTEARIHQRQLKLTVG
jgi:hypothetical protein